MTGHQPKRRKMRAREFEEALVPSGKDTNSHYHKVTIKHNHVHTQSHCLQEGRGLKGPLPPCRLLDGWKTNPVISVPIRNELMNRAWRDRAESSATALHVGL
ncbi:hypothetical protein ILYODFUR_010502 [Ilyodon furcidens]|uniref:Uncharacterized protein n=1 Tax=Ilyodon furcidens TaxID=33524 RepID=A0ABV0UF23_9TELE